MANNCYKAIILLSMTTVGFEIDPTELILSQIKANTRSSSHKSLPQKGPSFFQVEYLQRQILRLNAQEANQYQRTTEQQNMKQYLQEISKDKSKQQDFKHNLKTKYFRIRGKKSPAVKDLKTERQPIDMIRNFSQNNSSRNSFKSLFSIPESRLSSSVVLSSSRDNQKDRFANELQIFLDNSEKMTQKKSHYKLQGGTTSQKNKKHQNMMKEQRQQILDLIKIRNYSIGRAQNIGQIPNTEKYSLGYLEYMKTKTKMGLDRDLYEKKIRKIDGRLENFQEFILREVKLKKQTRGQLQNFYMKMRDQFRRIQKNISPKID